MRSFIILCGLLVFCMGANAQQNYNVSLIDKSLLPYASSVVRNEQINIEVKDLDNVIYHIKEAVTVLNKNGDDMANIGLYYNRSQSIRSIKGAVYNEFGKQTSKFSESNFEDDNTTDGFSLFEDEKVKHYQPVVTDYPYTVEYEYEVHSKQSLLFPEWRPNSETGVAVENSTYVFTCKPDFTIRYKEMNLPSGVKISTDKNGLKTYTWQINNLKPVKYEPYSPNDINYLSMVKIAPEKFSYEGITGEFTNWNELGKWIYDKLLANRRYISPATTQYIQQLTAGISDPKLKAKKIYEYMQSKTHYVSVQIGIGGYQPFLASDVDQLNYGDCKALVNYTQALLKAANIDSYYCVVMAGRERKISLLSDFASMDQGDHIILCIPFKNDTTWSDCTSQTIPFGYLGDFTDDRTVLACTPEGGKLMHTPKYTAEDNLEERKANFTINETGELSGDMTTAFKGTDYTDREWAINEAPVERIKGLQHVYAGINNMKIEQLKLKQDKGPQPVTTEDIKLKAFDYASVSNGKLYFLLNPTQRLVEAPRQVLNRTTNVYINDGYTQVEEISYTIPPGYHLDMLPLDVTVTEPFGKFSAHMTLNGNQLTYKRKLKVIDGTYPKDSYQDVVDFFQSVVDADDYNAALAKN
jgi:hypothetical protein